jgi:transposase
MWRGQARRGELGDGPGLPARFVRLDAPLAPPRSPGLIEIALPGGATLRVDAQVDAAALRRVLDALAGA